MTVSRRELAGLALLVVAVSAASAGWRWHVQRQSGAALAAAARPGDIHMIASATCGPCAAARAWFVEHRVPFSECTIESDAACRASFEATRAPGTPVLLVRGQAQLGFSAPAVLERLRAPRRVPTGG
jgi:hypothetical protein